MHRTRIWICTLLAGLAVASPSATATAKSVRVARIPTTALAGLPDAGSIPKQIASSARVDGFFPAAAPRKWQNPDNPMAAVMSSKQAARAFSKGDFSFEPQTSSQACFTAVSSSSVERLGAQEFPSEQNSMQQIWAESKRSGRVWIVRSERFVRGQGDAATMVVSDAYVDAVSLGAKLISRSTVEYQRVATGPRDIGVYAARDGDRVQFVVTTAAPDILPEDSRQLLRSLRVQTQDESGFSECGFLRTTMTPEGGGRAATVFAQVPLQVEALQGSSTRRNAFGGAETGRSEVVTRGAAVHLSVSRTSADRMVVVSVGFGWEDESRRFEI